MDQELQNELFNKYPNLFSNKDKGIKSSPMSFGIECGNGWFDIISPLCCMIKQHEHSIRWRQEWKQKQSSEVQKDFNVSVEGDEPEYLPVKFDQVKEKYGGLRVYFTGGDEYVEGLVSMAESFSYKICEVCGDRGKPNEGGWISTLCDNCRNKT
jgi:NADH pyrophosphatase NudC (nudix superfamily)